MNYILGKNVSIGEKILVSGSWLSIKDKNDDYITLSNGSQIKYGEFISGWKS